MSNDKTKQHAEQLIARCKEYGRIAVAFSGGVDSVVVAKAAQLACGEQAVAVTAVSPSLANGELENAQQVAKIIGIRHQILRTNEFANPNYLQNPINRCYFCKTELYSRLAEMQSQLNVDTIVNGANLDDRGDHRPGMQAAQEKNVRSPLLEIKLNKQQVRELAKHWNIPVWNKPATPCLSSRIAYGVEVTEERLHRVDQSEQFLRETFNIRELRVRHEANDLARIEIPLNEIPRIIASPHYPEIAKKLQSLGFKYITLDLNGFRSGSMNDIIPPEIIPLENLLTET